METIKLGNHQDLIFRPSEFSGVAEMVITNSETGDTLSRSLLSEAKALWAAVALVEAAGLLPEISKSGFTSDEWPESLKEKDWDAYSSFRVLRDMAQYRRYMDIVKEEADAHNRKLAQDAEALYNMDRSACDLIWSELNGKQMARWINIATKAEELNTTT